MMLGKAAIFLFGASQHAGVPIEPLHEPVIDSAESTRDSGRITGYSYLIRQGKGCRPFARNVNASNA